MNKLGHRLFWSGRCSHGTLALHTLVLALSGLCFGSRPGKETQPPLPDGSVDGAVVQRMQFSSQRGKDIRCGSKELG